MDSEKLNAFRTVAREKSFSRAAEKLYRTQPAVSQAIRSLETELGERLFHRLGKTVELTQAGRVPLAALVARTQPRGVDQAHVGKGLPPRPNRFEAGMAEPELGAAVAT